MESRHRFLNLDNRFGSLILNRTTYIGSQINNISNNRWDRSRSDVSNESCSDSSGRTEKGNGYCNGDEKLYADVRRYFGVDDLFGDC